MNTLDILTENMAEANIDIAVDSLRNLLKSSPNKSGINEREYFRKLDQYSKFISLNVWKSDLLIKKVKQKIIPLLKRAYDKITPEGKHYQDLKTIMKCRIGNLEHRYLNGLEPVLPDWAIKESSN